jgi:ferrochelatase
MAKTAVVLFNLGGPDCLRSVRPFLLNMFRDRAILGMPAAVRWPLAWLIATLRAGKAKEIYAQLGGGSPLLANTRTQADLLSNLLGPDAKAFLAMRYWHPRSDATAQAVKDFNPERIVLMPLYPQFSTTTTGSSMRDWHAAARRAGLSAQTYTVCCYPTDGGWIGALEGLVRTAYASASDSGKPRVLFSAHGLPKKIIAQGDPYQWQVEQTSAAVVRALGIDRLDWTVCYQSRVGPLEWIGPSIESEIARAGRDRVPLVVVPIAFVSEHSETLIELDVEYRKRAETCGVPRYVRVPTVSGDPMFIAALAGIVRRTLAAAPTVSTAEGGRLCPVDRSGCPCVS